MTLFGFWSSAACEDLKLLEDPQPQQVTDLFFQPRMGENFPSSLPNERPCVTRKSLFSGVERING